MGPAACWRKDLDPDELTADDVYQAVLAGDGLAVSCGTKPQLTLG